MKKDFKYFACCCLDCMHICRLRQQKTDTSSDLAYVKDKGTLVIGITLFAPMDYYEEGNTTDLKGFEADFARAVCEKTRCYAHFPGNKLGGKRERAQFKKC